MGGWHDGREGGELFGLGETAVFLQFFKDMPDLQQPGKVITRARKSCSRACLRCGAIIAWTIAGGGMYMLARVFQPASSTFRVASQAQRAPFASWPTANRFRGTNEGAELAAGRSLHRHRVFCEKCFVAWIATMLNAPADIVAVDGKTLAPLRLEEDLQEADPHVSSL